MLYILLFEKKKERKREREREGKEGRKREEKWPGPFCLGQTHPIDCAMPGFSQLLGAIKSCFKGQLLNFMCT
jgi:hypothetical protein